MQWLTSPWIMAQPLVPLAILCANSQSEKPSVELCAERHGS